MRVGVLQCDGLDPRIASVAGDYDALYADLLARPALELVPYRADHGQLPGATTECDAWLVGGSRWSVYDDLDWIGTLRRFVRRVLDDDRPLVGVCFGHQMIGQEMGATVGPAGSGWTVGRVDYQLDGVPPGEEALDGPGTFTLVAVHRDQVAELPDGATLLATAEQTPVAAFTVGSRVLAVQPHPEFGAEMACTLFRHRAPRIGTELAAAAEASLDRPLDRARIADWMAAVAAT